MKTGKPIYMKRHGHNARDDNSSIRDVRSGAGHDKQKANNKTHVGELAGINVQWITSFVFW